MKAGSEEVKWVEMILEGLGPGAGGFPVAVMGTVGPRRPKEAFRGDMPDEDAAAELEELREKDAR